MARSLTLEQQSRSGSHNISALKSILPFALRYKFHLTMVLVFLTTAAFSTLMVPIAVRFMVDIGFTAENADRIDQYFLFVLLLASVLALSSAGRYYFVMWLGERAVVDIRQSVYDRLMTLSPRFYETEKTGEVLSRLTTDTTLIQSIAGSSASVALRNILLFSGSAIMLVITSPRLSAYFLILAPAVVLPLMTFGRVVRRKSQAAQEKVADTSALASESLDAMQTVQAFTQERFESRRFSEAGEASFSAAHSRFRSQAVMTAIIIFLVFSSIVGILWTGARLVTNGDMTGGQLGQFILYATFLAGSLSSLSEVWGDMQRAAGAAERLVELLNTESDIKAPDEPRAINTPAKGAIEFSDVMFRYPTRDNNAVLENFNLKIQPGEKVAIVGPSGAGKTTVFQLLLRFYDPVRGSIRLDGIDLCDLSPQDLRRQFAIVPQDPVMFSGTLETNVAYGRPDASRKEIIEALEIASLGEFVQELPDGITTQLGPKGVALSGGQRQRIAIARAILRKAPILLLDEATSALDSENERSIQKALTGLIDGRTTLMIAHRLSTIQMADRVIVLDKGGVVESGTHAELMASGGIFAHLAEIQFGQRQPETFESEAENVEKSGSENVTPFPEQSA